MSSGAPASVTAVIAAAGSGERLGAGGPKALVPVAGRPMIAWSLAAFAEAGAVAIVIAAPPGREEELAQLAAAHGPATVIAGGATRSESVANALAAVETDLLAIHDAARPLVTAETIVPVLAALEADPGADGAIAAAPVTDTIKRATGSRSALPSSSSQNALLEVEGTVDRGELWAAQTPQAFRAEALRAALAAAGPEEATDEAMLIEAAGGRVLIVPTTAENLKVTTPLDLRVAESLLSERGSVA